MFAAALGCNLAWGLVDAVMYLVRTITERAKWFTLVHAVRAAADPATGCRLLAGSLSRTAARLLAQAELEAVRRRIVAYRNLPDKPALRRDDLLAAVAIFLIVVASTFPVVLPFVLIGDVGTAMIVSRGIALAMLFLGGLALGHYAGYGHWKAGFIMVGLGTSLVAAIIALGG
jgi:VIT1/CCC1 family predicted Fe2+/Mn2+ transporter